MPTVLNKAGLLDELKLKTERITLGKGEVIIREVSGAEYMEVYTSSAVKDPAGNYDGNKFVAVLATRCIVDEKGRRLFSDEDAEHLRGGGSSAYTRIITAVNRVNGLGAETKN